MLNELAQEIHRWALQKGWWEVPPGIAQAAVNDPEVAKWVRRYIITSKLALIISEVAEALEELRAGNMEIWQGSDGKPEGFPIELDDALIRVLDLCAFIRMDIDTTVREKMEYNKTRPHKHGGKYM